jgi:hypothetical protein
VRQPLLADDLERELVELVELAAAGPGSGASG